MAVGQGEFTHQKRPRSRGTVALLVLVAVGLTPGSRGITGPKEVRGELGQSVTVECRYIQKYKDNDKLWCKGEYYPTSPTVVSTDDPQQGRTSMSDDKTQRIVSVTIDKLEKSDEGYYWCVIVKGILSSNERTSILLTVSEGSQTSRPDMVTTTSATINTRARTTLPQDAPTTEAASSTESQGSTLPNRDIVLNVRRVWGVLRWVLFGVLLLFPVSISCVTTFKRKRTAETLEMGSAVVEEGAEQRR
ncbi:CMRF35-like molecule 3 [Amblyraja radiata]|uniref:CMRF35-like molecule 3 n=1 Tax=Amblyraja radiata TaxID=386614 RepID=UPI0014041A23|nr:CMRF35-like molecule 3 [Amblyraja radiata]